jgi:hypothetical protein
MSNKITIELCEEDRKRLDSLFLIVAEVVAELKAQRPPVVTMDLKTVATQEAPEQPAPEINHPVDEVSPHGEPEPAAEPEQPKYTKDDVLAKVQSLAGPNNPKREEAKAIVKSYGAKVSDIPEDKYAEVMDKLTALEG